MSKEAQHKMVKKIIAREFLIVVSIVIVSSIVFAITRIYIKNILVPQLETEYEFSMSEFENISKSELKTLEATEDLFFIFRSHNYYGTRSKRRDLQLLEPETTLDSFMTLLISNIEVAEIGFKLFRENGYGESFEDFMNLMGASDQKVIARTIANRALETKTAELENKLYWYNERYKKWEPTEMTEEYSYFTLFLIFLMYPLRGLIYGIVWSFRTLGSSNEKKV